MKQQTETGFTLIETLMAMAIFTIGILALFGMQTAAITENLAANNITTGSVWAMGRVEQLISLDYNDPLLVDGGGTNAGCAGLNDWPDPKKTPKLKADSDAFPDAPFTSGTTSPIYTIYWNVAQDCTLTGIPVKGVPAKEVQRPKHVRVIVTVDRGRGEEQAAVFNYIKQNI